jgi:hypothetical protein
MGYSAVYAIEISLLGLTLWAMLPLMRPTHKTGQAVRPSDKSA